MIKYSRFLLYFLIVSLLAGCGWHMRGSHIRPDIENAIYLTSFDSYGESHEIMQRKLQVSKALADSMNDAGYALKLTRENLESNTLSITDNNNAAEYELILELEYRITNKLGEVIVEDKIAANRHYQFNRNRIIAKEREQEKLLREMREDLTDRLLRRLGHLPANQN